MEKNPLRKFAAPFAFTSALALAACGEGQQTFSLEYERRAGAELGRSLRGDENCDVLNSDAFRRGTVTTLQAGVINHSSEGIKTYFRAAEAACLENPSMDLPPIPRGNQVPTLEPSNGLDAESPQ